MARRLTVYVGRARTRSGKNIDRCCSKGLTGWQWPRLVAIVAFLALVIVYGIVGREDMRDARDQAELNREILVLAQQWAVRE